MTTKIQISTDGALAIQRLQRSGYRGAALVRDPPTRTMIVFLVTDRGCTHLAEAEFAVDATLDTDGCLLCMPGLKFRDGATPNDVFSAVEREIRRLASWTVH